MFEPNDKKLHEECLNRLKKLNDGHKKPSMFKKIFRWAKEKVSRTHPFWTKPAEEVLII
jgi:hypothetical protein